ncbi:Group II intron reverse transcriptase/maturase (fragment) [Hyella patelloides LEGE 07179]|uniref:Group II intron reverse transcriptase/maturase n=2 Tax=Hyella TaxID=945733 RepID=A0A563VMD4_9CYAN
MEYKLKAIVKEIPKRYPNGEMMPKERRARALAVIRYADDFVIIHDEIDIVNKCKEVMEEWLNNIDLELKPSKTRVAHTLQEHKGNKPGFDFLGFHIQQFKQGRHHSGKNTKKELLGFKTIIKPQKEKIQLHYKKLDECINKMSSFKQSELIGKLTPIIRGWCNYQSPWNSSDAFQKLNNLMWNRLWRWGKRRHPNKGRKWIARKYWNLKDKGWRFTSKSKTFTHSLPKHTDFSCGIRWTKVQNARSPYDGDESYWSKRMGDKYRTSDPQKSRLMKIQKGKCGHCGLTFRSEDLTEKHHIKEKSKGGNNSDKNLVLIHLHCHDKVHGKR